MEYTVKEVKFGKNRIMYVPIFEDASLKLLEEFLMTEVKNFKKQILAVINKAKEQPTEVVEFAGNVCLLSIQDGTVRIECTIDDAEIGNPVELKFDEFDAVVHSWINDTQK